ncbi:MAG: low molecular weight protein-tyrosine-phosphatase [Eggerthellaceae bacterium]|jgi:protein-tyrosine phosphatase
MNQTEPTRILFVCHGNICRSPMAQCVMQHIVNERGIADRFVIDSAATTTEALGSRIYPPARRTLERAGVQVVSHRARQVVRADGDRWDYIVYMDAENEDDLRRILGPHPKARVVRLLSLCQRCDDVADPWYTGDFETAYADIADGCRALADLLE